MPVIDTEAMNAVVNAFHYATINGVDARELSDFLSNLYEEGWQITRKPDHIPEVHEDHEPIVPAPFVPAVPQAIEDQIPF